MNKLSKRVLSLLLALLMVLGTCDQALAAGLDNGRYENDNVIELPENPDPTEKPDEPEVTPEPTPEITPEPTEEPEENTYVLEGSGSIGGMSVSVVAEEGTFEEGTKLVLSATGDHTAAVQAAFGEGAKIVAAGDVAFTDNAQPAEGKSVKVTIGYTGEREEGYTYKVFHIEGGAAKNMGAVGATFSASSFSPYGVAAVPVVENDEVKLGAPMKADGDNEPAETWTVTFYNRDAEVYKTVDVVKGEAIGDQLPGTIAREDYNAFWAIGEIVAGGQGKEIKVTGARIGAGFVPEADTTIVPDYDKITYTVTFYQEDKTTEVATKTVNADTSYCLNDIPAVPTKAGYNGKWVYKDGDFGNTVQITADMSVWAEYDQSVFTVTFMSDGKTYKTDTFYKGDALELPADPVVEGKDFVRWVDENSNPVSTETKVTRDMTITAVFNNKNAVNFVIMNDDGTESERLSQYFRSTGEKIGTMPQDPFVAGKVFEKWVIQGTDTEVNADTVVTGNMTVVAVFRTVDVYNITAEYYYLNDSGSEFIFNTDLLQVEASELPYTITAPASTKTSADEVSGAPIYYPETPTIEVTKNDFEDETTTLKVRFKYIPYTAEYDFVYMLKDLTGNGYTEIEREHQYGVLNSYVTPTVKSYDYAVLELAEGANITQASGQELPVKYTRKSFQLSYETNGGSYVSGTTVPYGTSVNLPATNPTRSGYTFAGWYSDKELTEQVTGAVTVNADTTLYAKWNGATVNYTIVYMFEKYNDAGTASSYVYDNSRDGSGTVGSTVQASSAPSITRTGWEIDTAKNATSSVVITADGSSVLFVYYKLTEYTLNFDRNHQNRVNDYVIRPDGTTTTNTYTIKAKIGQDISGLWPSAGSNYYSFMGWQKNGQGTRYVTKQLIMNTDLLPSSGTSITYKASWGSAYTFTVNYYLQNADDNGYTRSETYSQTYNADSYGLTPKEINGYKFDHGNNTEYTTTYNLYYNRNTYNIDYFYGSTKLKTIESVKFDANINKSPYVWTPTAAQCGVDSDYTFEGWYSDSGLTTEYAFSTMPASNLVLYAKWSAPTYTVSFVDSEDTSSKLADDQELEKYAKATRPTDPTKAGYVFDGWYTTADGSTLFDWNTQITADTTVYAKWSAKTLSYTVKYVDEEGNDVATSKTVSNPNFKIGQEVTEAAIAIAGYKPQNNSQTLKLTGEDTDNVITFVYVTKAEFTSYIVNYVIAEGETGAGTAVATQKKAENVPGDTASVIELAAAVDYDALYEAVPELNGQEFFPDEVEKTLVLAADETQNILTFYYSSYKSAKVTVHFVDVNGEKIPSFEDDVQIMKVGKTFTLSRTPIEGWELKSAHVGNGTSGTAAGSDYKITDEVAETGLEFTLVYQKKATITVNSQSKQYDGTALKLPEELDGQVTVDGLLDGDSLASVNLAYTNADVEKGRLNAGTATVTPSGAKLEGTHASTANYYTIRYISGTLEVTKINVTVRIEPDRWTGAVYNGTEYKAGFTNPNKDIADYILISHEGYSEKYLNDIWNAVKAKATYDASAAGLHYYGIAKANVGDYTYFENAVTLADLPNDPNYSVSLYIRPGRLQILPVEITITPDDQTKVYDNDATTDPELTATVSGLPEDGVEPTYTLTREEGQNVGEYKITVNVNDEANPNYTINVEEGTFTITKRPVTFTGESATKTYTGSEITLSTVTPDGLLDGHTHNVTYSASGTNAGEYPGTITAKDDVVIKDGETDVTGNYEVTVENGKLTITPIEEEYEITVTGKSDTKVYNAAEQSVNGYTVSEYDSTITFTGIAQDDEKATAKGTNVGTYTMTMSAEDFSATSSNYTNIKITVVPGTLKITQNEDEYEITVTGKSDTKVYNTKEQSVNGYTVSEYDSTITFTGIAQDDAKATAKGTNVGTYTMTMTAADFTATSDNYKNIKITVVPGTLEITPITDEYEITVTGKSDTKVYNTKEQSVNGYTVSEYDSTITFTGIAQDDAKATAKGTNVGTYTMTMSAADFSATSPNYTNIKITVVPGTLEITPITDKVTVTITENNGSEKYDGSEKTVTGYTVSIDNELYTEADFEFKGDATVKGTDAGTYNMELKPEDFANTSNNFSNVEFVIVDGTLEIAKRTVTLTSESGEKPYDGTALTKPEVTVSGDGFVEGEATDIKATGSVTTVAEGEVTNTITYTEGANFKADNYTITKNEGKLKITQREVTVSVADKTVPYNGSEQSGNTATTFANVVSGQTATIGYTPSKGTLVNTYDNGAYADDFKVVDGDGNDVTANYTLGTQTKGKLIITDEDVPDDKVVTKTDGEENDGKKYHIGDTVEWTVWVKNIYDEEKTLVVEEAEGMTITSEVPEKLAAGKEIEITVTHVVTAADVAAGSIKNEVKVKLGDLEKTGDDTVETEKIKITVTAASQTKQYDGTALTNGTFTVTPADPKVPVAEGDTVTATVTGSQTEVGSSANTLSNVKVSNTVIEKDAEGKEVEVVTDVTDAYDITLVNGTLTVTTVPYTINYVFTWPGGAAPAGAPNPPAAATVNRGANYTVSTATYADIPYGIAPNGNVITVLRFQGWDTTGTINNVRSNRTITGAWTIQMVWYTVTYTDGVPGEVVFPDQVTTTLRIGANTPAFAGTPTREGFNFTGWAPAVSPTVTGNNVYTAQWAPIEEEQIVEPTPEPTPVVEEEIVDEEVPQAAPAAAWALINLLAALGTVATAVGMIITFFKKKDDDDDGTKANPDEESDENKGKKSKFLGLIPAVASVIIFILTENMHNPMTLVDKWTIPMVLILAANGIVAYLTRNKKPEDEDTEKAAG